MRRSIVVLAVLGTACSQYTAKATVTVAVSGPGAVRSSSLQGDCRGTWKQKVVAELGSLAEDFRLGLRHQLRVDRLLWFGALGYHFPDGCEEKSRDQSRCQVIAHDIPAFQRRDTPRTAT